MRDLRLSTKIFLTVGAVLGVLLLGVGWLAGLHEASLLEKHFDDNLTTLSVASRNMFHATAEAYCRSHGMAYHRVEPGGFSPGPAGALEQEALRGFQADPALELRRGDYVDEAGRPFKYVLAPGRLEEQCVMCHQASGMDAFRQRRTGDLVAMFGVSVPTDGLRRQVLRTRLLFAGMGAVLLAVVAWIVGMAVRRHVLLPVDHLNAAIGRMAGGDLTVRAPITSEDEIGHLGSGFNRMVEQLARAMLEVERASAQVASGSMQLAASAEQMSVTVHETARVGEGLQDSGRKVQENLRELDRNASVLAGRAQATGGESERAALDSTRGAEAGQGAADEMEAIRVATSRIAEAVRVIQEIARQTNLLSLNAAIEAAKAGSQGKGFAVVAEEVRKLADRSSGAAKEIEEIIGRTQEAVAEGVASVEVTRDNLVAIRERISAVGEHIREMGGLSLEQARTSAGVGELMDQTAARLDRNAAATQQLAATVQEVTRTAEELARVADGLKDVVKGFRLRPA
jgi:methyl-accepting chemotaxis protein